ncbi:hypothetical protein ACFE04_006247 [Oxalis oulophora]
MGKKGKSDEVKFKRNPKRNNNNINNHEDIDDDEIDTFHKQRDFVPLDINGESDDSDDDQPVLDLKYHTSRSILSVVARQSKYLQSKIGGVEDESHEEEVDEEMDEIWKSKHGGRDRDIELESSDNEALAEEEREVLRLQAERAKMLSPEDFGIETISEDEGDRELTLEELAIKGKSSKKSSATPDGYEEIKKDITTLSKEEQMDVVYSSAPELVGLLSELNDTVEELDGKVNPLLAKVKDGLRLQPSVARYLEIKQQLLLTYCQSITFYLLLKSEGQPVRDHPVIGRLVEIKELLDKVKQLDENCQFKYDDYLTESFVKDTEKSGEENMSPGTDTISHDPSLGSSDMKRAAEAQDAIESENVEPVDDNRKKGSKRKHESDVVGLQSIKMLKTRAALEEKLKQTGVFSSVSKKVDKGQKHLKLVNGQLETPDDFDDDTMDVDKKLSSGRSSSKHSVKLSQLGKANKSKFVSGDDDLPRRDNIGERRMKHELRVLAGAGVVNEDNAGDDVNTVGDTVESDGDTEMENSESEDDYYKQVKEQREAKLAAKAEIYTRTPTFPSLPETVDGKRKITTQIEKNRGLTRPRNKKLKNPRKKYRVKHDKQEQRRKGQVREVRKPIRPYDGEHTGINAGVSRSVRFKN